MNYSKVNSKYHVSHRENIKDKIDFIIGDDKQIKFYPQIKIMRWDNDVNFSIRLVEDKNEEKEIPIIEEDVDKIKYIKSKKECHFYDILNSEYPEGACEFEIILKEKPITNLIEFSVQDKDIYYNYQPILTNDEILEGCVRPDNIIGSYSIYINNKFYNKKGGKEYKTGKFGHIYRPLIIDANGSTVWGDLKIENKIISVIIPQSFIDNAVYPIKHAAGFTIGFTSIGGTTSTTNTSTAQEIMNNNNGNIDSITVYGIRSTAGSVIGTALYSRIYFTLSQVEYLYPGDLLTTDSGNVDVTSLGWHTCNMTAYNLSRLENYWLAFFPNGNYTYYYDSNGSAHLQIHSAETFENWSANFGDRTMYHRQSSIYTTITSKGPENLNSYNGNLRANISSINRNEMSNIQSLNNNY